MNAWHWPEWNLDICRRVCPCCLCISCIYVCTYMQVCSVCIPTVSVSDHWHVCVAGISGQGNSASTESFQHPPLHAHARTHKHITHPTADTHMSPQQPDTAEDMLLTEKERPPYWQTRAFQRVELLGSLITFFFFKYFFSWEPKNFIFIISSSTWRCIFTLTLFLPHGTHIDWFNLECSLSKPSSSKWCDVSFMCHHDRFTRWCYLTTDMVRQENKEGNKLFCLFVVNIKCTL